MRKSWRRAGGIAALAIFAWLCGLASGCLNSDGLDAPAHVDIVANPAPDPADGPPITGVRVEQGGLAFGAPRLDVDARGRVVYRERRPGSGAGADDGRGVYESEFTLTPEELSALHAFIAEIGFSGMKEAYHPAAMILDGDVCTFIVTRGDQSKKVYCNNAFPRGLWLLRKMAFQTLPAAHAAEIAAGGRKIGPYRDGVWMGSVL